MVLTSVPRIHKGEEKVVSFWAFFLFGGGFVVLFLFCKTVIS